ncbi:MAG: efflux RND transporter periplasmic adaptor subunit [Bryobacteraceae bacterium]
MSFALAAAMLLAASCAPKNAAEEKKGKKGGEAVPVAITKVMARDVPVEIEVIGNVEAFSTVQVKCRVTGPIEKVHFTDGTYIKKGDTLFSIDPAPFQSAVNQAEANLARDRAQLQQVKATLERDTAQYKFLAGQATRFANLQKEGVISKDIAEQHQANADVAAQAVAADKAAISSSEASIQASEAALKTARIQLGYTTVLSPIDGRTGTIMAKEGNLGTANVTELVTISQVQPIYVAFSVPESQLGMVKDAMSRGKLPVTAAPPDDPMNPETGTLTFIDSGVDPSTGTIRLKGQFANSQRRLWPGQFVRVRLRLGVRGGALLVPNQVVQTGQDGPFVYRVKEDNTVEVAKVKTAGRVNDDIVIGEGLEAGETVVTEGQLRLAPGSRVRLRGAGGEGKKGGKGKGKGFEGGEAPKGEGAKAEAKSKSE